MTAARSSARLTGAFVGASSAAFAVAAHAMAGAILPGGASVVVLVLACAAVGALASSTWCRNLPAIAAFVGAGQLLGHVTLVAASGHSHGAHTSAAMVWFHVVAAVLCAGLIWTAERLCAAAGGTLVRLLVLLTAVHDVAYVALIRSARWLEGHDALRFVARSGPGTRGPPALIAA